MKPYIPLNLETIKQPTTKCWYILITKNDDESFKLIYNNKHGLTLKGYNMGNYCDYTISTSNRTYRYSSLNNLTMDDVKFIYISLTKILLLL